MVTLHARIRTSADGDLTLFAIKTRLAERFGIAHATVEIERGDCADRECGGFAAHREHEHEHSH